ncbi:MAG: aspartate aminotransferase family protein, partial [Candidatus Aminicenantes bacterium]|nr:aspartate aminotransferase family protein [Candidatus Aminicenantes bacterium]
PLVDFQNEGLELSKIKKMIEERLVPHLMRYDLPRFQSMFNAFPEKGAKFGAQVALDYNQGVTNWQVSPGGAVLEEICCKALCRLFGLSENAGATLMYCGTYANQQALYIALHAHAEREGFDLGQKGLKGFKDPERLVVLTSKDAHFSLKHSVRMMGLGEESLIPLEVDSNRKIDVPLLKKTLEDLQKTRDIFCIAATTGTTSTGSVDPILPIAELCRDRQIWLHVDGAYGLAYGLVPEWKNLYSGIDRADSLSWDPHKQMGVPIPNSVLFVRQESDLYRMALYSDYFNRKEDRHPNPGLKSPPTTRPLSALPLAASIRYQGMQKVTARLRAPLDAVRSAADYIRKQTNLELTHRPDTGILCFRVKRKELTEDKMSELQQFIYERIMESGERTISVTKLEGLTVLRLVAISPEVTGADLIETLDLVRELAQTF